jgi:precorrin-6B methylase 2
MERLYLTVGGHVFFQTLSAAVELDLFTILSGNPGLTSGEIASRLSLAEKPARILLLGCTSLGLIRRKGDRYRNTKLANRMFNASSPQSVVPIIRWQNRINYRALYHLHDSLKANTNLGLQEFNGRENTLYGRLTHHPELEAVFQEAMQAISDQANAQLAAFVDFSKTGHLVDVGGGNGSNIIALAQRFPSLRASVFDAPSVCEIARSNIEAAGLSDRLHATPGDCFEDSFPADVDAFLFAHFFTIWSREKNLSLLRKSFENLREGGAVILFNMMQSNDRTGPLTAAMGSPYFLALATGEGMLYTWSEYTAWMREAGFRYVEEHRLAMDHGIIIGYK